MPAADVTPRAGGRRPGPPASEVLFGLALAAVSAAFLAVYLLTRAQVHGWDSLAYAARAAGDPLLSEKFLSTRYFHPHHLLYVPFAQGCRAALGWLPGADLLAPLQWANSLLGAGCVLLAGLIVRALGGGPGRALFAAAAVGFANGVWTYATAVEVMIPALFCLLLTGLSLLPHAVTGNLDLTPCLQDAECDANK